MWCKREELLRDKELINKAMKDALRIGQLAQYQPHESKGMYPLIKHGDRVILELVLNHDSLTVGDIVFCEVQPGNRFYCHMILDTSVCKDWHLQYLSGSTEPPEESKASKV